MPGSRSNTRRSTWLISTPRSAASWQIEGKALPDGSFPIRNREDLKDAIQSYGRANDKAEAKRWIRRRARELNAEKDLPEDW